MQCFSNPPPYPDGRVRDEDACLESARTLIVHRADVNRTDGAGYTPLQAAAQWGKAKALTLLLQHGADVNQSNPREGSGFTALMAALAEGHVECVRVLVDAGADTSLTWSGGNSGTAVPLNARAIAASRREHAFQHLESMGAGKHLEYDACIEALTEFDRLTAKARALGVLSESELDALTDRVAKGESQRTVIRELEPKLTEADDSDRLSQAQKRIRARKRFAAFEHNRSTGLPETFLYPKSGDNDCCVAGGQARVVGLEKRPELNEQVGRIESFNTDGRRRFALRLENGKTLSLSPSNLAPVDVKQLEYPVRCTASSASVCAELQRDLAASGSTIVVVDWTPLTEDTSVDMPNVYQQGLWSAWGVPDMEEVGGRAFYVQRTGKNEAFFLCHREFMNGESAMHASSNPVCVPWLIYNGRPGGITIPPVGELVCTSGFMARMLRIGISERMDCSICLKMVRTLHNPSQLPCVHYLCTDCLKQLFPLGKRGLTCPTCKTLFPDYRVVEHAAAPGGVVLQELIR